MAALGSDSNFEKADTASEAQSSRDNDFWAGQGPVVLRDPAIKLLSPVSGLEPLSWAEDHRLAASSTNNVSLLELVCDIHSLSQNLVLHRTHIPVPDTACELKVTTVVRAFSLLYGTNACALLQPCCQACSCVLTDVT